MMASELKSKIDHVWSVMQVGLLCCFWGLISSANAGIPSDDKPTLPSLLRTFLSGKPVAKFRLRAVLINREIKQEWLDGLSKQEIRLLKNAVFALYGARFQSADLQIFFKKQSWYRPLRPSKKVRLSSKAKKNIKIFGLEEKRAEALSLSNAPPAKSAMTLPKEPSPSALENQKPAVVVHEKQPVAAVAHKRPPVATVAHKEQDSFKKAILSKNQKEASTNSGGRFRWLFFVVPLLLLFAVGGSFYAVRLKKRAGSLPEGGGMEQISFPRSETSESLYLAPPALGGAPPNILFTSSLSQQAVVLSEDKQQPQLEPKQDTEQQSKQEPIKARFKVYDASLRRAGNTAKEISELFGLNESSSTTLSLFFQGYTLEDIIEKRGLAESTIKTHFKSALEKGAVKLEELLEIEEGDLLRMVRTWQELGGKRKLSAAFERMDGRYDYDLLGFVFAALSHDPNMASS